MKGSVNLRRFLSTDAVRHRLPLRLAAVATARSMLNCQDHYLVGRVIKSVVDKVRIFPHHQFSEVCRVCARPLGGNNTTVCKDSTMAVRTLSAAKGLRARRYSSISTRSRVTRGANRGFIGRSGGTHSQSRPGLRIRAAKPAQGPLERLANGPGQQAEVHYCWQYGESFALSPARRTYSDLTIPSVIFLASPNSIIVLSR